MDHVYVVLRWDKYNLPQYIIEAYETLQDAQYRARGLSVACIGIVPETKVEKFLDNSECLQFIRRDDAQLFIYKIPFTPNRLIFNKKAAKPLLDVEVELEPSFPLITGEPDDPYNDYLPAGWFHSGTPAMMSDLWCNPHNIQYYNTLTNAQKWALTEARIRNRPNFYSETNGNKTCYQIDALQELKSKSSIGEILVEEEMSLLEETRAARANCINNEI